MGSTVASQPRLFRRWFAPRCRQCKTLVARNFRSRTAQTHSRRKAEEDPKAKVSNETRSRRSTRVSRQATVEVRAGSMTIQAPKESKVAVRSVCVQAVMVREVDPPRGEVPVEWILLTTLPISTVDKVRTVIQYYMVRWMIEIFFRTLKSGLSRPHTAQLLYRKS